MGGAEGSPSERKGRASSERIPSLPPRLPVPLLGGSQLGLPGTSSMSNFGGVAREKKKKSLSKASTDFLRPLSRLQCACLKRGSWGPQLGGGGELQLRGNQGFCAGFCSSRAAILRVIVCSCVNVVFFVRSSHSTRRAPPRQHRPSREGARGRDEGGRGYRLEWPGRRRGGYG